MAEFEPTEAEKAANSYLDWDDAELGKFTKYIALKFDALKDDAKGLKRVTVSSCAMMLMGACVDSNAAEMTLNISGFSHKSIPEGDWTLVVKRKSRKRKTAS